MGVSYSEISWFEAYDRTVFKRLASETRLDPNNEFHRNLCMVGAAPNNQSV